jgi:hypothetical protein
LGTAPDERQLICIFRNGLLQEIRCKIPYGVEMTFYQSACLAGRISSDVKEEKKLRLTEEKYNKQKKDI